MSKARTADQQCRDHTSEAIDTIHEIMTDPLAEHKDRLRAAETLLDRGHGKAVSAVISVPASRRIAAHLATMSDEELLEQIRSEPLPRLVSQGYQCPADDCPGDHLSKHEFCGEVEGKVEEEVDPLLR